jgi:hypothetical protein
MKPRLTGLELLQTITQFSEMSRSELAKKCGYVNRAGKVQIQPFLIAILAAKGEKIGTDARSELDDTQAYYKITPNGVLAIPHRFNEAIDCNPGDYAFVEVDIEAGVISIKKDPRKTQKSQIVSASNGRRRSRKRSS